MFRGTIVIPRQGSNFFVWSTTQFNNVFQSRDTLSLTDEQTKERVLVVRQFCVVYKFNIIWHCCCSVDGVYNEQSIQLLQCVYTAHCVQCVQFLWCIQGGQF